jgi:hemerythrin-like domain-containing protein
MKEEQVLYPMAEKLFSEEKKELFKQIVTQEKGNI